MSRAFVDANVPIYAAGRDHPLKAPCRKVLELAASNPGVFFTDAEVLQEMLHRYLSLRRWPAGKQVVLDFAAVMGDGIEAVHGEDVALACTLADDHSPRLAARDLLHAAVMIRQGADRIVTADTDFDELETNGMERLDPAEVESWGDVLTGR